ncbi:TIGR03435 family protein [Terriglobus roseus]|uniref:Soil-associated protein, TIGR03435 family n=1 Tax=Terriglobus roseus TaxID=392734 RepID=A0A1H4TA33_9BACT|nr:TIGR03435 family protein [Terriglobus roseus]SEC53197.1 soil-associated protein, TIGR03435 family [Terriglobus roseus]
MALRGSFSVLLGLLFVAGPVAAQTVSPTRQSFEVTTVRPAKPDSTGQSWHTQNNRTDMENFTLRHLIRNAYRLKVDSQVLGGPEWMDKDHFDITAKMDDEDFRRTKALPASESGRVSAQLQQSLLAERFDLPASVEQRSMPVYALVLDAPGNKLVRSADPPLKDGELKPEVEHIISMRTRDHDMHLEAKSITMADLTGLLSDRYETGHRVVVDQTGLTGNFDFKLDWAQDNGSGIAADATQPGLIMALREQLGLRLEKQERDVPVVVVQSAALPQFD